MDLGMQQLYYHLLMVISLGILLILAELESQVMHHVPAAYSYLIINFKKDFLMYCSL